MQRPLVLLSPMHQFLIIKLAFDVLSFSLSQTMAPIPQPSALKPYISPLCVTLPAN